MLYEASLALGQLSLYKAVVDANELGPAHKEVLGVDEYWGGFLAFITV